MTRGKIEPPAPDVSLPLAAIQVEPPLFDGTPSGLVEDDESPPSDYVEYRFGPRQSLHGKLSEIYSVVGRIPKTGTAPTAMGGYSFVEAGVVAEVVRNELAKRRITLMPVDMSLERVGAAKNGTPIETWKVTWLFVDGDTGETHRIVSAGSGADSFDKASPKAQTNAMKYALLMAFLIPTGEDPERYNLEEPESPSGPIVINGSNIPGITVGGSQSTITGPQFDEIRRLAREKQLDPLMMKEVIASVSAFPMDDFPAAGTVDEMRAYIIDVIHELSFDEAAKMIDELSGDA